MSMGTSEKHTRVSDVIAWLSGFDPSAIVFASEGDLAVVVDRYDYSGGANEHLAINGDPLTDADR